MIYKNLFQHSKILTPEVKTIVKPLSGSLGIEHFGYLRIYKDSSYYYLSNDLAITQRYIEKVRQSHIYCDKVLQKDNHSSLKLLSWPSSPTEESMEIYLSGGFWSGLSVLDHSNPDYIELWWIAPSIISGTPHQDYNQYANIIIGFVKYFNSKIISQIEFTPKILARYDDGFEFNLGQINEFDNHLEKMRMLVHSIFPKGFEVQCKNGFVKLSSRQTECLRFLSQGKCIKEISRDLNLSGRTVEKHIKALQEKLGYSLKSDLVKLFNEQISYFKF